MNDADDGGSAPTFADLRRRWRVIRRIHRELDYSRLRELELDTDLAEHESRIAVKRSPEHTPASADSVTAIFVSGGMGIIAVIAVNAPETVMHLAKTLAETLFP